MAITDLIPWKREQEESALERRTEPSSLQDMNRLFDDFFRGSALAPFGERWAAFSPRIDITENEQAFKVSAELPGVDQEDIDLTLSHNVLTIRGEKREETERQDESCYCTERSYGSFRRSISLPTEVDADQIEATYQNGVLTVTLPKTVATEGRKKISVKAE